MHNTENLSSLIIEAIQNKKGYKISLINLEDIESAPSGEFIICQGNSTSQVSAIADSIREELQNNYGIKPYNYDGYRNSQWIVIDYGNVMVHIFLPEYREFYNLEELWSDAKITHLQDFD